VDLEHRQRPLGLARRERSVAAGDRGHAGQALGELAPEPRRHPAAVRHAGDEDPRGVDADGGLELVERALDDIDVIRAAGHRAAHVPERVRAARRRIGHEEVLAIGQTAEARVVGEVLARLARAVQGDDQRPRLVGPARRVQEDLALALGRVDRQRVVARRQRGAGCGGGLRCIVDRLRSRLPGHEGDERESGDEDAGRPRLASGHAETARAQTKSRQSTTGG
jgi:hypothetical protein